MHLQCQTLRQNNCFAYTNRWSFWQLQGYTCACACVLPPLGLKKCQLMAAGSAGLPGQGAGWEARQGSRSKGVLASCGVLSPSLCYQSFLGGFVWLWEPTSLLIMGGLLKSERRGTFGTGMRDKIPGVDE